MKEIGMINGQIDSALNRQGHMDLMMVVDAGFPCPDHVELIDIAVAEGTPKILDVLAELNKYHSVEKIVMAQETSDHNPTYFQNATQAFGEGVEVEVIPHTEFKVRSHKVKTIIRTGDFTAWGNVMLVSGAGDRWQIEKP
ncbi:MAG: D-ribose pyranase [Verrucomicrobiae bacterium]|nr:D-ribose pyranase [Verrucomicrobiae bacterium]NNJ87666.1 D-ribose pyranase [Akkermansiaceae bacterium]